MYDINALAEQMANATPPTVDATPEDKEAARREASEEGKRNYGEVGRP